MALNRLSTSCPKALMPELLELSLLVLDVPDVLVVPDVELVAAVLGTAYVSSVVSALCAPAMLSLESAVETLARNSPSGLLESAFEGASFSTSARYFLASVVSPDLMEDIRLESAPSKEFWLLLEELETDDVASSEKRELVLCNAEIDMNEYSFHTNFSWQQEPSFVTRRYKCGLQSPARPPQGTMHKKFHDPICELRGRVSGNETVHAGWISTHQAMKTGFPLLQPAEPASFTNRRCCSSYCSIWPLRMS